MLGLSSLGRVALGSATQRPKGDLRVIAKAVSTAKYNTAVELSASVSVAAISTVKATASRPWEREVEQATGSWSQIINSDGSWNEVETAPTSPWKSVTKNEAVWNDAPSSTGIWK